ASPDRALVNLERFAQSAVNRPALFRDLAGNPRAIEMLVTLFAGSQFLTEILLRNPEYFERLTDRKQLAQLKSKEQFYAEALAATASAMGSDDSFDALRRLQRWELLRIGACDFFGFLDLPTITAQLSHLAESTVRLCLRITAIRLDTTVEGLAVIALGKLGGEELNYSSDIDLLFLAASDAATHQQLGRHLIEVLAGITAEGFLYRVDMRLRPWGRDGALVSSIDGHLAYLYRHARLWEKQVLLKARVIAGDRTVGNEFLRRAEPLLFDAPGEVVRTEVQALKRRIEAGLRRRGRMWGEVKSGEGSIRDIEFVTQYLQLIHGAQHPEVRSSNTLDALTRLAARGLLPADEYRVLTDGYTFLRTIEHYLQLMEYRQTHTLPNDPGELTHLARRLGFEGAEAGAEFLARYQQHSAAIRAVYQRHLEREDAGARSIGTNRDTEPAPPVARHLSRMGATYAATFSAAEIERHAGLVEHLDASTLVEVDARPLDESLWQVTIVGYDYLGELSLICGLLSAYGFNILDGHVFTYEPVASRSSESAGARHRPRRWPRPPSKRTREDSRRKIVDVFTVRPVSDEVTAEVWSRYRADLQALLQRLQAGQQRGAQGELARRVGDNLPGSAADTTTLYPVDIEIDNAASQRYTVLHIDAPDTVGFLYELTNALALNGAHIARVTVDTIGTRVHDTLAITDSHGQKITAPSRLRELRAATVLVKHFTHLLPHSPNPESALLHFREFLGHLFTRPDWPDELASLERPEVLGALARLLGVSDFLWEDFLRMQHNNLFPVVRNVGALATAKSIARLRAEVDAALQAATGGEARRAALNAFKDHEMFRVDMRHILGRITEFGHFSAELTDLAEVVVDAAYRLCEEELRPQFGLPRLEDGTPCPLSICALGKCGGRELGFASDIELMFLYAGNGTTTGPHVLTTAEFYVKFVQAFLGAIQTKRKGIFEVDLRLRPYGKAGSMAVSLEAFRHYFAPGGTAWPYERQALVKLRPIAGDAALGEQVVDLRDEVVYRGEPFDVAAMRAMRERQLRQLVTAGTVNAKFSPGGLVDVEYLVQGLQITYGHRDPSLRRANTRAAMVALAAAGILSPDEYTVLTEAHTFLRRLINALRMVRGDARELTVPPVESEEFAFLARRLNYGNDLAALREDLRHYTTSVQALSARLLQ
ncbi:MAG TPA: glutamine synthetase adenylyltransferase, partial [Chloroflexi bacterium]|nr:glutamine synthetase adenylyltransferase [Chloroflexota bacterium]